MEPARVIQPDDDQREGILNSIRLSSDEPLILAVEAMIEQAKRERPTHPKWHPLGARNAEGISRVREALEALGGWSRAISENGLDGVQHLETGIFLAVHNTCELTGLNKGYPRFLSARKRKATKSLRDDIQGDFCEVVEDFGPATLEIVSPDETALHLCCFIDLEKMDTGEQSLQARAELFVGAACSDRGVTHCKYRLPLDLSGLTRASASADVPTPSKPNEEGAVEPTVSVRKRP